MDLILLAALIVLVVLYRRRGVGRVDVGTMVRRFLEYGFLYGLGMVSAIGATGVMGRFLGLISDSDVGGPEELALWLSLLIVAGGALVGLGLWLRRRFRSDPTEVDAAGWSLYRAVVALTAVGVVVAGSIQAIGWLLDGWNVDTWMLAAVVVWAVIGVIHRGLPGG